MHTISPCSTVAEAALLNPAATRVLESYGLDYCCGGKRTLTQACDLAGIPLQQVLHSLESCSSTVANSVNWNEAPVDALIRHIVEDHHSFVRSEIPRLEAILAKVVARHAALHPEFQQLQDVFRLMGQELSLHLLKEEQILFPAILRGAVVNGPVARMMEEHDDAGAALRMIRKLTNDYKLPEDSCNSVAVLYQGLENFESDLHQHIHLENNVLFPKAVVR